MGESFWKHYEFIVKNGPSALLVLIVVVWLAGDYGFIQSQSRVAASMLASHVIVMDAVQRDTAEALKKIVDVLEQQRLIQAQTGLLACLKEAKNDTERTNCVRQFPLTKPTNGGR
jgi:hypothetical protein